MRIAWLAILVLAGTAQAAPRPNVVAAFSALQEAPALAAEQTAPRSDQDAEIVAAEAALNEWKLCVVGSLDRWAPLHHGPGLLVDGAFGRCADIERSYRTALTAIAQDGRRPIDTALARNLTQMLRDGWRLRLTALALDRELAAIPLSPTVGAVVP
jgi:hypothetical protein